MFIHSHQLVELQWYHDSLAMCFNALFVTKCALLIELDVNFQNNYSFVKHLVVYACFTLRMYKILEEMFFLSSSYLRLQRIIYGGRLLLPGLEGQGAGLLLLLQERS